MLKLTLVSGAAKNVGDYLIFSMCKKHIENLLDPDEIFVIKRWKDNKEKIEKINETDAIIICGGPGVRQDFYPNTYSFLKYYNKLEVPVIPFGVGWEGKPFYLPDHFKFNKKARWMIRELHSEIEYSSVRDIITKNILNKNGIDNVINTGCPTLFDKSNTKNFKPDGIEQIIISMAQQHFYYDLNVELIEKIKEKFPKCNIVAAFHRGIVTDKFTTPLEANRLKDLIKILKRKSIQIEDLSYDLDKMKKIYLDSDLHVGFRVHGHAFSISQGIPSFLFWEDGRGQGMSVNLNLKGYKALIPRNYQKYLRTDLRYFIFKGLETRILRKSFHRLNPNAVEESLNDIKLEINRGFEGFSHVSENLEDLYNNLKNFINTIPVSVDKYNSVNN